MHTFNDQASFGIDSLILLQKPSVGLFRTLFDLNLDVVSFIYSLEVVVLSLLRVHEKQVFVVILFQLLFPDLLIPVT